MKRFLTGVLWVIIGLFMLKLGEDKANAIIGAIQYVIGLIVSFIGVDKMLDN